MTTETPHWSHSATFYSIYPLGACEAPSTNDGGEPVKRIHALTQDVDRVRELGFNALYLGPVFESDSHGYDTRDYFSVDRRLGTDEDLAALVSAAHERDMHVVLDGVYNHTGRGFWAFERLREQGPGSEYAGWFAGVDFSGDNRFGDRFVYNGWEGVEELVSLNHANPAVREHLIAAALHAADRYRIDGIRLDVAYSLPLDFLRELSSRLHEHHPDFWLLGEVIHGDYAEFLSPGRLQSVTNYECYKGLWSSFNDANMHEIAHSLSRLFGEGGLLTEALRRGLLPFGFADNHDVSRLASTLTCMEHIYPLYGLLWSMPGIPSVYYGSEYGIPGRKDQGDDALRPSLTSVHEYSTGETASAIAAFIGTLNQVRSRSAALRTGAYRQVHVAGTSLTFERFTHDEQVLVAVSADADPLTIDLPSEYADSYTCLFSDQQIAITAERPVLDIPANGVRLLRKR